MKSIRYILILFLIFIFLNSCASTKKNTGETLDKKTENIAANEPKTKTDKESDTDTSKDSENAKNSEKIIIMKVPEAESVESVSDPKPVADKPALELIVDTEDENEPASSNNEAGSSKDTDSKLPSVIEPEPLKKPEEKKPQDSAPSTSNQSTISVPDKKQIVKPADDPNKVTKPEIKKESLEKPVISSDKAPTAAETKPSAPEVSGVNDKNIVNEEKIKDGSDPARIFSEFPSTEPDDSKEEKASRSVKLYTGQRLEVVYPGEGWVYLGESTAQKGIKYQQRKLQSGTSIFHFGAGDEGSYILNFSYFDVFSDNFISDSIAVHVEKAKTKLNNTVKAPDYKGFINAQKENKPDLKKENKYDEVLAGTPLKAESSSSAKKNENTKVYDAPDLLTVTEKSEPKTSGQDFKSASELLDMIRGYISEGNAASALNSAEDFFKNYSVNLDEALFLRGQAYELNGPNKNIKKALEAYQTLTKAYPESKFWDKADARIRYIKKFYIDIK